MLLHRVWGQIKWSDLGQIYNKETAVAFVALSFVVTQAPIFQNVGAPGRPFWERFFVVLFYGSAFISLFFFFLACVLFHRLCPYLIKCFPRQELYVEQVPVERKKELARQSMMLRSRLAAEWDQANNDTKSFGVLKFLSAFSLLFWLAAYVLGPLALAQSVFQ